MFYFRVWHYFTSEFGIVFCEGKLDVSGHCTKWEVQIGNYELRGEKYEGSITNYEVGNTK
jgi:hypothetical protein